MRQQKIKKMQKCPCLYMNNGRGKFLYLGTARCSFQPDGVNSAILLAGWVLMRPEFDEGQSNRSSTERHEIEKCCPVVD